MASSSCSGDFDAAADAFRQSVEIAPTSEGYSNTGTNYYYAARYEDAVAMFEQASRLAPEDSPVLGQPRRRVPPCDGQGRAREQPIRTGDGARAAALGVNPDSIATRTQLAYFLVRQGETRPGKAELETAGSAPIGDLNSHYYAALVYKELGRTADAVAETLKALEDGYPAALLVADPEFMRDSARPGGGGSGSGGRQRGASSQSTEGRLTVMTTDNCSTADVADDYARDAPDATAASDCDGRR